MSRATSSADGPFDVGGTVAGVAFDEIPVVSLAEWTAPGADRAEFADRLREICHEVGFFQLVDHGVDPDFVDDYFAALDAFFALPDETKAGIDKVDSPWFRGWSASAPS